MFVSIYLKNTEVKIADKVFLADTFCSRLKGLMLKKKIDGDGLILLPCKSIHTFFMFFPIDIIFIGKDGKCLKIIKNMKPWRLTRSGNAYFSVEFNGNTISKKLKEGDYIEFRNKS